MPYRNNSTTPHSRISSALPHMEGSGRLGGQMFTDSPKGKPGKPEGIKWGISQQKQARLIFPL